jgi:diguanylate cyclase (GGDEF)-like protein
MLNFCAVLMLLVRLLVADRSRLLARVKELEQLAYRDELTGLPNRRFFNEQIEREAARAEREHRSLTLVYIDVNKFKQINDTLGHDAGDAVLKQIAFAIQSSIRKSDWAARMGGDEFVVVLNSCSDVGSVISRIRKKLVDVTISCGVATYTPHVSSMEEVIKAADQLMYEEKKRG